MVHVMIYFHISSKFVHIVFIQILALLPLLCPNISTTPITAMGCQQGLPLSVVQLKGKHCQKFHCRKLQIRLGYSQFKLDASDLWHATSGVDILIGKKMSSDTAIMPARQRRDQMDPILLIEIIQMATAQRSEGHF